MKSPLAAWTFPGTSSDYLAQAYWHGFRFRFGEMIALDRTRRLVHLCANIDEDGRLITPVRSIGYDTLVIAIGSVSNFGTPGVKEHAICLDTPEQAQRFNRRLVNACLRAHTQAEPVRPGQLHVAIIGAGATGTELSAELHRTVRGVVAFGLDRIDPDKDIKITVIEAADRVVPALPRRLSDATAATLAELGVEVRTGARVTEVGPDGVHLAGGDFIPSELVVWAAGVRGPRVSRGPRRPGDEPVGPARGAPDTADDAGRQCLRDGRLRLAGPGRRDAPNSAARPSGAPAGLPSSATAPTPPGGQARRALRLSRFRLAGVARRILDDRQPDGFLAGKGMLIEGYVARLMYRSLYKMHEYGAARAAEGRPRHHLPVAHPSHRAACEAALNGVPAFAAGRMQAGPRRGHDLCGCGNSSLGWPRSSALNRCAIARFHVRFVGAHPTDRPLHPFTLSLPFV